MNRRWSERNSDGCVHATHEASHAHQAAIQSGVASYLLAAKKYFVSTTMLECTSWHASIASKDVVNQCALVTLGEFAAFRNIYEEVKLTHTCIPTVAMELSTRSAETLASWRCHLEEANRCSAWQARLTQVLLELSCERGIRDGDA